MMRDPGVRNRSAKSYIRKDTARSEQRRFYQGTTFGHTKTPNKNHEMDLR